MRELPARPPLSLIFMAGLLCAAAGCQTTVHPPSTITQPTTVYLTDEVVHSSILMPADDGRYVEYAFGDWAYAALDRHDPFHTVRALFFSPQGALGRRFLSLNVSAHPMNPELKGISVHALILDRADVNELTRMLDARIDSAKSKAENPENHFLFATVAEHYSFFNNCNTLTKRSLRQLKCDVESRSPFAMYDVVPPPLSAGANSRTDVASAPRSASDVR
jgi:hypothetical protein